MTPTPNPAPTHVGLSPIKFRYLGIATWLGFIALLSVGTYLNQANNTHKLEQLLLSNQGNIVHESRVLVREFIQAAEHDIRFLVESDYLRRNLGDFAQGGKANMRQFFIDLMATRHDRFSQMRLIGLDGKELLRVDNVRGRARAADETELQNKSERYYVEPSVTLSAHSLYFSDLDPNIERGQREVPVNPTMRVSMAAFDSTGQRVGFYIINLIGNHLLDRLRSVDNDLSMDLWMVNQRGDWMIGPSSDLDWQENDSAEASLDSFAGRYPALWALRDSPRARTQMQQQVGEQGGLMSMAELVPRNMTYSSNQNARVAEDFRWYLISHISSDNISALGRSDWLWAVGRWLVLVLLFSLMLYNLMRFAQRRDSALESLVELQRDSRKQLEQVLEAGRQGVWDWDIASGKIWISPMIYEVIGYNEDDVSPSFEFLMSRVIPEDYDRLNNTLSAAIAKGEGWREVEYRITTARGQLRWVSVSGSVMQRTEEGAPARVVGSLTEITARKLLEIDMQEQKVRLETVLANAAVGILITNGRRISWANQTLCDIYGYELTELAGRSPEMLYPSPRDYFDLQSSISERLRRGEAVHQHIMSRSRDGQKRWVRATIKAVNPLKKPVEVISIVEDISDQQAANQQRRQLLDIINMSSDCIYYGNLDGQIAYMNPGGYQLLGLNEETLPEPFTDDMFLSTWAALKFKTEVIPRLLESNTWQGELALVNAQGQELPVSASAALHSDANGIPATLSCVLRDISHDKQIQQALSDARRTAEQADAAKSDFIANMSHEIRTPLHGIIGTLNLLSNSRLGQQQIDYVNRSHSAANHLLTLIDDILDYSKIEADMLELDDEPFSLRNVMLETKNLMTRVAEDKGLDFMVSVDERCGEHFIGDQTRLIQVLINLIGNAIKFTTQGEVRVHVEPDAAFASSDSYSSEFLRFSVSDTGIGIAENNLERLFDRFIQAESSSIRRFSGTGLGLAISQRLVRLMRGEIRVESTLGRGSEFWFVLPLTLASESTPEIPGMHGQNVMFKKGLTSNDHHLPDLSAYDLRVLAVEDNPINLDVLRQSLQLCGIAVDVAENGLQAVSRVRGANPKHQMVLMDVQMPVMDGVEACERIRLSATAEQLPIIGLTADTQRSTRLACLNAGMNETLLKPFAMEQLVQVIARYCAIDFAAEVRASSGTESHSLNPPALDIDTPDADSRNGAVPGVNPELAISNLGGNVSNYLRLVRRYLDHLADTQQSIVSLAEDNTPESLQKIANLLHSLAGSADTIGAQAFAKQLSAFEKNLKAETLSAPDLPPQLARCVGEVEQALRATLTELEDGAGSQAQSAEVTPIDAKRRNV